MKAEENIRNFNAKTQRRKDAEDEQKFFSLFSSESLKKYIILFILRVFASLRLCVKIFLFFGFLLSLSSCQGARTLTVRNTYLAADRYASLYVNTPDPHRDCPSVGQQIDIQSYVPTLLFCQHRFEMIVRLRFGDNTEETFRVPIVHNRQSWGYKILDDSYFSKNGIIAYHVVLYSDEEEFALVQSQLWVEMIKIEEEDAS